MNEELSTNFYELYNILVHGKNLPELDYNICNMCGGMGVVYLKCCNGNDCGCLGLPYDFDTCDCGIKFPSHSQILTWK